MEHASDSAKARRHQPGLVPLETTPSTAPKTAAMGRFGLKSPCVTWRHSGWQRHRTAILAAEARLGFAESRRARFAACGSFAMVFRDQLDPERLRVSASYCRDRFCLPCQLDRAKTLAARIIGRCREAAPETPDPSARSPLLFITLTIKHQDSPLADQIAHLRKSFNELRCWPLWSRRIRGGVTVLEIKRARDDRHWHPHLHIIAEGLYIKKSVLSAEWHRVTGTSYIVDIQRVRSDEDAVRYLTSYLSKPLSYAPTNRPHLLDEALAALRGVHLWWTWGGWKGSISDDNDDDTTWLPVGSLDGILAAARGGDRSARMLLSILEARLPWNPTTHHPARPP
ncbi:MAG: protein rep [Deltaproteobacteria bacterium]|nr:protein rep [Deltaproteobacteria bacterium]